MNNTLGKSLLGGMMLLCGMCAWASVQVVPAPAVRLADFRPGGILEQPYFYQATAESTDPFNLTRTLEAGQELIYRLLVPEGIASMRLDLECSGEPAVEWSADGALWNDLSAQAVAGSIETGLKGRRIYSAQVDGMADNAQMYWRLTAGETCMVHRVTCFVDGAVYREIVPGSSDDSELLFSTSGASLISQVWTLQDAGSLIYQFPVSYFDASAVLRMEVSGSASVTYSRDNLFYYFFSDISQSSSNGVTTHEINVSDLIQSSQDDLYVRIKDASSGDGQGLMFFGLGILEEQGYQDGDRVHLKIFVQDAADLKVDFSSLDSLYDTGDERLSPLGGGWVDVDYVINSSNNTPNGTKTISIYDAATLLGNAALELSNPVMDYVPLLKGMGPHSDQLLAASLAGLVNRESPRIYLDEGADMADYDDFRDDDWFEQTVDAGGTSAARIITDPYAQLAQKYAAYYNGVVVCDDGSFMQLDESDAPQGVRDSYAVIQAGHTLETDHGWYLAHSALGGGTPGWSHSVYRAASLASGQYWIYEVDLPDTIDTAVLRIYAHQSGVVSVAGPSGVNASNHAAYSGTQVLSFSSASFETFSVDVSSYLNGNAENKLYIKFAPHPSAGDLVVFRVEVDNGVRDYNGEAFQVNVATTLSGVYGKLICNPDMYYTLKDKGMLGQGQAYHDHPAIEFEPGTAEEAPHVWYEVPGGGGTGGSGISLYRYAWLGSYWIYELDLDDGLQRAMMRLSMKQNGIISVAGHGGVNAADHSVFNGTKVLEYTGAYPLKSHAVDLTPYLQNNPENKVYVKFASFDSGVTDGILLFHLKVDEGYSQFYPTHYDQTKSGEAFADEYNGLATNEDHIYVDGNGYVIYRLQLPEGVDKASLSLDIQNQYLVELSADRSQWTEVARESGDVRDGSNRTMLSFNLDDMIGTGGQCWLRLSDSIPANGWGAALFELRVLPDPGDVEVFDIRGLWSKPEDAYRWAYRVVGAHCSQEVLGLNGTTFYPDHTTIVNDKRWWGLIDFLVMKGAYTFYFDQDVAFYDGMDELIHEVYGDKTILDPRYAFGWARPEHSGTPGRGNVPLLSNNGIYLCAGESLARNASFFERMDRVDAGDFRQDHKPAVTIDSNKIYTAIARTDGDNTVLIQARGLAHWVRPERGSLPLGWGWLPDGADLLPGMMQYYYRTRSENDYFLSGVGGRGYIMTTEMDQTFRDTFYAASQSKFIQLDMDLGWILEHLDLTQALIDEYVDKTQVGGLFVNFFGDGSHGLGGMRQIPFFNSLDSYDVDPDVVISQIRPHFDALRSAGGPGFVFFCANGWTMDVANIQYIVDNLGPNVEVLRPDVFAKTYRAYQGLSEAAVPSVEQVAVAGPRSVNVRFSQAMGSGALAATNYTIYGAGRGSLALHPVSVQLLDAAQFIYQLTWTQGEMVTGGPVQIVVTGVQDAAGTVIRLDNTGEDPAGGQGTAPYVVSIMRLDPSPASAVSVRFRVTFSEPVFGLGLQDLALLQSDGLTGCQLTALAMPAADASVWDVSVDVSSQNGVLGLGVDDADASVTDLAGNPLDDSFSGGQTYVIHNDSAASVRWLDIN